MATATSLANAGEEDFAALLDATLGPDTGFAGSVVTGRVLRIDGDFAVLDVGLKSEGRVPLKEFAAPGQKPEVKAGDVYVLFVYVCASTICPRNSRAGGASEASYVYTGQPTRWGKLDITSP